MKYQRTLTALLLVLLILTSRTALADWPTAAANPQRTSWVSTEVTGSLKIEWCRPIEAYMSANVNLIAANSKIYVATARGLYALDAADGSLEWAFDTQIPIGNSPTVVGSAVYVPGLDRQLYALDDSDGSVDWVFDDAKAGFSTNPLVVSGVIYIGNRDGRFYAINASNGNLIWQYPAANDPPLAPINLTAAYDDGVIYFAASDCYAYALDTDGDLVWKSNFKLPGPYYASWWPVIYQDKVVYSAANMYRQGRPGSDSTVPQGGLNRIIKDEVWPDETYPTSVAIGPEVPDYTETWAHGRVVLDGSRVAEVLENDPNTSDWHVHHPWQRTTILVNANNGTEYTLDLDSDSHADYAPLGWCGTNAGHRYPPIVNGNDDVIYQVALSGRTSGDFGMVRHDIFGWKIGTKYLSVIGSEDAGDEPTAISSGGNVIYKNLCCCRLGVWRGLASGSGSLWHYSDPIYDLKDVPGNNQQVPGLDVMWWGRSSLSGLHGNYGNANGLYHDHGDQNPIIPYNSRVYVHRSNAVICYGPGTEASSAMATLQMDDTQVDTLPTPTVNELVARLEDEIDKIIDAGNLNPGYHNVGQWYYSYLADHFINPGDTLMTLCRAYPHLNSSLQSDLETYLQSQFSTYFNPTMYATKGWNEGNPRDWMNYPKEPEDNMDTISKRTSVIGRVSFTYPPHNFYAMWQYAEIFPSQALTVYNLAKPKMTANSNALCKTTTYRDNQTAFDKRLTGSDVNGETPFIYEHNMYITGYIGFLELQELANMDETDSSLRTLVQNELNRLLTLKYNNFTMDSPFVTQDGILPDGQYRGRCLNLAANFMYMCPELGDYLYDNIYNDVEDAIEEYNWVGPYWFIARYNAAPTESGMSSLYDYSALFNAKAYALKEQYEDLVKYLDVSAFKVGDLFYIDNLIAAIESDTSGNLAPSVDAGSNQSITLPDDDVSLDATVTDDGLPDPPASVSVTWSKDSGPGTVSFGNDNAVDTTATFSTSGTYILRLTASDSDRTNSDTVQITVNPSTPTNQAPSVDAGSNDSITLPDDDVSLDATVTDDGLPDPPATVSVTWTKQSGDGTVTFGNANAVDTTATFSTSGTYVLRLTASDSSLSDYDDVTITVNPQSGGGGLVEVIGDAGFEDNNIPVINLNEVWDGNTISEWFCYGTHYFGIYERTTGDTHGGTYKAELDTTEHNASRLMQVIQLPSPTVADEQGTLKCWLKGDLTLIDVLLYENKPPNNNLWTYRDEYHRLTATTASTWTEKTLNFTPTGEYNWVALRVIGDDATSEYSYLDDFSLQIYLAGGEDANAPTPDPLTWSTAPYATGDTSISMTATTASDPSGVEYYFDCTAGGGNDSGWQDSTTYEDTGLSPSTQYTYRVQARDKSANQNAGSWSTSESATTDTPADTTPPTPDPLTWSTVPYSTGTTSISMTATTASDPCGVEYYFDCTAGGGNDSGWHDSTTYEDTGLSPSTQYTYRVQARDKSANQNTGGWSTSESATTDTPPDTTAPTPNPLTWSSVPYATGSTSISMTATTASDPSGVEYYFDCTAGGGNDSGWQDATTYQDTGLTPDTQYTYRVQARDKSANQNAGSWSTSLSATTDQASTPALVAWYEFSDNADDSEGSHNGSVSGDPNYVDDGGMCLEFDGDDGDMVTVYDSTDFDTSEGTWMMWVRTDGSWGTDGGTGGGGMGSCVLMDRHNSSSSTSGMSILINPTGTVNLQAKDANTTVANPKSTGTVTNNAWHHIAVTWEQASGGDMLIYIDGSNDGSTTNSAAWSFDGQDILMGDSPDTYWEEFAGRMDEVRIYNYAMDANAIDAIYEAGRADPDVTAPTPDPLTWSSVPTSTGTTSISMTATTASDPSGVEYYFDCTAGGGHDSGWQDSTTYEDTGLSPSTQYTYRVQARDKSANQNTGGWSTSESATTDTPADTTPPTPNPLTWASVPASTGTTSISMTATTASDPSGVEYYFDCTAGGGNDSGWQDSSTYEDTGLSPSTQYTYRVQARDKSANQNAGGWSTSESATTDTPPDTTPPTPDPLTWSTAPYATGDTSISMTATTASDPSGVEYYFECTAGGGNDSGWQDSTTYEDTGLDMATQYTYHVRARDKSANQNATAWSTTQSATTDVDPDLVAWWELENNANDSADDHDGSVSGPSFVTDSGYCLEFDGDSGDDVTISSSTDFDTTTGTWMMWIRTDGDWGVDGGSSGTSTMGSCVVLNRHGTGSNSRAGIAILINPQGTVNLQAKNSSGTTVANPKSTGTVTNNAWHHIAVTWDQASGGDMLIYIDGSNDGGTTNSAAWAFDDQDVLMGDSPDAWWEEYAGRLDDVRVYDYELTQTEINAIYQQGR